MFSFLSLLVHSMALEAGQANVVRNGLENRITLKAVTRYDYSKSVTLSQPVFSSPSDLVILLPCSSLQVPSLSRMMPTMPQALSSQLCRMITATLISVCVTLHSSNPWKVGHMSSCGWRLSLRVCVLVHDTHETTTHTYIYAYRGRRASPTWLYR